MNEEIKKENSVGYKVVYGIIGVVLAFVIFYIGIGVGSSFGDKIADIRGVSYDSYTAGISYLIFMIFLLLLGYLFYRFINKKNIIFSKFFFWTFTVLDSLYVLYLLIYLSL